MNSIVINNKMRLPLVLLLILAMVIVLLPISARAADTYSTVTVDGLDISVSSGTEGLQLQLVSGNNYNVVSSTDQYPFNFSLILDDFATEVSGTPTVSNGGTFERYDGNYCLVTLPEGSTSTVTIVTVASNITVTLNCSVPSGGSASIGGGIASFIPAPGQFVNENIDNGGWGDIYSSGGTNLKTLKDGYTAIGVSLGAFGGSIVLDFGAPAKDENGKVISGIYNDAKNLYGADFIVYGNAFTNWSEPGCIQVSEDGSQWYDIAGSRHYMSGTDWNYEIVYANPTPADNTNSPFTSTCVSVPYADTDNVTANGATQTWGSYSTMATNSYHNHSWFPLARNYFDATDNTATTYTGTGVSGMMANLSSNFPFVTLKESQTVQDSSQNSIVSSATATLAYKGVNLNQTAATTSLYTFGYADVHAKGTVDSEAHNPYGVTGSTTGGDPIDISWAVNTSGEPVNLASIRYVRIYTGVMNVGSLGETSTEVCGCYRTTTDGNGAATTDLLVYDGTTYNQITTDNMTMQTVYVSTDSRNYEIYSGESYVYVNGEKVTCTTSTPYTFNVELTTTGQTAYYQIITQNGTESPYITLLKFVRS